MWKWRNLGFCSTYKPFSGFDPLSSPISSLCPHFFKTCLSSTLISLLSILYNVWERWGNNVNIKLSLRELKLEANRRVIQRRKRTQRNALRVQREIDKEKHQLRTVSEQGAMCIRQYGVQYDVMVGCHGDYAMRGVMVAMTAATGRGGRRPGSYGSLARMQDCRWPCVCVCVCACVCARVRVHIKTVLPPVSNFETCVLLHQSIRLGQWEEDRHTSRELPDSKSRRQLWGRSRQTSSQKGTASHLMNS